MQLDSVIIILLLLFIFPIIILFSNPNIFFIITSIIIILSSLKKLNIILFEKNPNDESIENVSDEMPDDFESISEIDYKKLVKGIRSLWNFFVIIFFVYCIFYVNSIILKEISVILIAYRLFKLFDILSIINFSSSIPFFDRIKNFSSFIANSFSIIFITIVCCNKFIRFYL
ncbi:MAG TPA: hypothetical protein VIO64_05480 [Pseudobacteroides sp.]|uniref:hypothetical protein n=1 Tax=Pseudobacteroides sp. TaxID=1968840 RepID=UPI002F949A47